jgi:hypothetical protein
LAYYANMLFSEWIISDYGSMAKFVGLGLWWWMPFSYKIDATVAQSAAPEFIAYKHK